MLNLLGKEIQKVDTFALDVAFSVPHPSHPSLSPCLRKTEHPEEQNQLSGKSLSSMQTVSYCSLLVANAISPSNSMGLPATFFLVIG